MRWLSEKNLLFSRLNKPISLNLSSWEKWSSPLVSSGFLQQFQILLVLGVLGLGAVCPLGPHEGRTEGESPLPFTFDTPLLMQCRILLAFWVARAHSGSCSAFCPLGRPSPSQHSCLQWVHLPVCTQIWDCPDNPLHTFYFSFIWRECLYLRYTACHDTGLLKSILIKMT